MTPAEQLADLRKRVARLERALNGTPDKPGVLIAGMGQALGVVRHALEQRLDQIEQRQLKFLGIYESGRTYRANSLVVRQGSLWCALTPTTEVPGRSAQWQLVTKQGEIPKERAA